MPYIALKTISPPTFPKGEDDHFEFKSSRTSQEELKAKLNCAASGFANSGGGCFIYGLDKSGDADGGVSSKVGRQGLRDWLDQVITRVTPTPLYDIRFYEDCEGRGALLAGNVIAAISFPPSELIPHQASDGKYYIRAGAHTLTAGHYIVEALWARRQVRRPLLSHVVRAKPSAPNVIQIGIVAVTGAAAIDVEITVDPLYGRLARLADYFPVRLPVVDRGNPFYLDVALMFLAGKELADDVKVSVTYRDYAGNIYTHQNESPLQRALSPIRIGDEAETRIASALETLDRTLREIGKRA